jgi:SAM-dependent methyltransferase
VHRLLDDTALERSSVVANNAMNRERRLDGVNSYARELGFHPLDAAGAGWLDLCCGSGLALAQAATVLDRRGLAGQVAIVGVDLVDSFCGGTAAQLHEASIVHWTPGRTFDLITCLHGLHYVGDKLGVLSRAAGWLAPGGRLVADLDLAAVRVPDGRLLRRQLRAAGFSYDPRRRRIGRVGPGTVDLPYVYLGADDRAGPNYTGQPAVDSYYEASTPSGGQVIPI